MITLTTTTIDSVTELLARRMAARSGRRTLIARVGKGAAAAGAFLATFEFMSLLPGGKALAGHCGSGYHAGAACFVQTSCAANIGALVQGGCWYSCCPAECGGQNYQAEFCDCCDQPSSGGGGYCAPDTTQFACKLHRCYYTAC